MKKILPLLILLAAFALPALCQDDLPVPPLTKSLLFYVQRSTNNNTIVYELNYNKDGLNAESPVHPFWILYAQKGEQEDLNYIQRKFAYGIKSNKIEENHFELKFVSYDKYKLELMQGADNQLHVYTTINNKKAILTRIYLKISGGTFWFPHIEYFEVVGIDPADNSILRERVKIT